MDLYKVQGLSASENKLKQISSYPGNGSVDGLVNTTWLRSRLKQSLS